MPVVHRTPDGLEAEILTDLLLEASIPARLIGHPTSSPFGLETDSRIEVPADHLEAAQRVIAEHLATARLPQEDEPSEEKPLSPLIAAGVITICPGGAHLYARRPLTALAIAAGELTAVICLAATASSTAAALLLSLLLIDLVFGQLALRAHNRGVRLPRHAQALRASIFLTTAAGLAFIAGPLLERPLKGRRARRGAHAELRSEAADPRHLPFPLHLDFKR